MPRPRKFESPANLSTTFETTEIHRIRRAAARRGESLSEWVRRAALWALRLQDAKGEPEPDEPDEAA